LTSPHRVLETTEVFSNITAMNTRLLAVASALASVSAM
jgi:hypothetical protein